MYCPLYIIIATKGGDKHPTLDDLKPSKLSTIFGCFHLSIFGDYSFLLDTSIIIHYATDIYLHD